MSAIVFVISDLHLRHKNMAIRRGFNDEIGHDNFIDLII